MPAVGVIFAFAALLSWGFGDFFIQRASREVGVWKALLAIGISGSIVLFPFVYDDLAGLTPSTVALLTVTGFVILAAALLDFEALREGKLAVIEPVLGLELPVAVLLGISIRGDALTLAQLLLIAATFIGITLAATVHHTRLHYHKRLLEKGVRFALAGAALMGVVNFLVGVSSQETSALMAIWFTNSVFTLACVVYLVARGELGTFYRDVMRHGKTILAESALDNAAWLSFAFATTYIPISIATTISESYIALVVLLGVFVNREKLKPHQLIGIACAVIGVVMLSVITR